MTARILVVDDNPAGRYFKTHVLRKAGHEVVEAATGSEALGAVAAQLIDIVLLDVKLPDISGIEVCRQVKAAHADILVLQTSAAFTASHDRAAGLGGGADSYLAEPVEAEELTASVEALLRLRRAERDLRALNDTLEHRVAERTRDLAAAHRKLQEETAERVKVEEALRQSQKMEAVGQLTGGVAHDFNNLLTVISANLELLEQAMERPAPLDKERGLKMVRAAQRAAGRGEKLTQQLLSFARRQVLRLEVVDLNALVGGFDTFLRQAAGESIKLDRKLAPELWAVRIDPTQFEAALLNLAVNARDAMPSGGTLHIETRNVELAAAEGDLPAGRYVLFEVSDTGTGMSEETRERAFEPFYTTKDVGKGSGLGLSQVYGFVKQAGGRINIDSVEGKGTRFRLYLPCFTGEQRTARSDAGDEPAAGGRGERVLLVEDNGEVREVVRQLITGLGYQVLVASDGRDALEILERGEPVDLLFSDVVMPNGVNGVELARQAVHGRSGLRVLLTSGYAPDRPGADEPHGEFALLAKPYRRAELARRLRAVLDRAP